MQSLSEGGEYTITDEMKKGLADFVGGYSDEAKTANTIKNLYEKTGYVIDTHTAVAAGVYKDYVQKTGDNKVSVIASTASPFKFTRSVMEAIDEKYASMDDFALIDELSKISNTKVPQAIEDIRTAPVLHDRVCDVDAMQSTVKDILK